MGNSYTIDTKNFSTTLELNKSSTNIIIKSFEEKLRIALANIFADFDNLDVISDYSEYFLKKELDTILSFIAKRKINVFQTENTVREMDNYSYKDLVLHLIELYSVIYKISYFELKSKLYETITEKNQRYGDAALNPMKIFINTSESDLIKIRLQDKLSRIKSAFIDNNIDNEDALFDVIGYLVLLEINEPYV